MFSRLYKIKADIKKSNGAKSVISGNIELGLLTSWSDVIDYIKEKYDASYVCITDVERLG